MTCTDCGGALGPRNRSGFCRSCRTKRLNADPALQARRRDGLRAKFADPTFFAQHVARCAENTRNISDEARERRRAHGRRMAATLQASVAAFTPELRAENGRKRSDTVLAWCPPEWRDKYRDLKKRGRRAAEAKAIVLRMAAGVPEPVKYAHQKAKLAWCPPARLDEYRRAQKAVGALEARRIIEADMTPFERQLARVAQGAALVEVRPLRRRTEPTMTLGGVPSSLF